MGEARPSDIGEADVDVAVRWAEENIPEARRVIDVKYMGESKHGPLYQVIYEMDESDRATPSAQFSERGSGASSHVVYRHE